MAAIAHIKDGKIVESTTASSLAKETKKSGSTMDKEAFLKLLVAQMKYQDPLEPTSNTEFVSQYAQFSSLEQMQNMSATLELSRASTLVGQTVSVNTTDSTGKSTTIQGVVDYVVYENNKAYVSIGGELYSLDDVYGVANQQYLDAYDKALAFGIAMNKLPSYENLTLDDKEDVDKLKEIYDGMSNYEKTFVAKDFTDKLDRYVKRIEELVKDLIGDFMKAMDELPAKEQLKLEDKEKVDKVNEMYQGMSDFEKGLVSKEHLEKLEEAVKYMEELEADA
ncbi:MAG: flagellar hook capping protein [Lachnospiraceae bacterium]|nr:flagellar hook capping protein [Lachnospiraceae bacterium]MCI9342287.1 flagellar hook capping protein [Lachnospiraceae bacterium]GFH89456.1 basal-body rod modification protein FlgD [Lachnospiraceae bacterium]